MAKLERTSVPGVYRAHKKTCENSERCDCPYKVIWRHRGRQYSETCRSFTEAREQKALRATVAAGRPRGLASGTTSRGGSRPTRA